MKNVASNLPASSGTGSCAGIAPRSTAARTAFPVLFLLAALVLFGGCSDDSDDISFPTPPAAESKLWLYDVYGRSASDVYVGGYQGAMAHFDGTAWTEIGLGSNDNVVAIWGNTEGTLYAVGGGGSIWKNSAASWSSMESGTSSYLVGLGSHYGSIYASGVDGALVKLTGSTWSQAKSSLILRDPSGAPTDTLSRNVDVASLVTVNHYFIGGAYHLADWDADESIGTEFTDGMVLGPDVDYPDDPEYGRFDWQLRPLRGDEIAPSEWIQCSTSDPQVLSNNYLGTTEGWVFQLSRNDNNRLVWSKLYPRITEDPRTGINDMWLDASGNLYMVTHDGYLVFQSHNYSFIEDTGFRVAQRINSSSLMGLWAEDTESLFIVGLIEKVVLRYRYDEMARQFEAVASDTLQFADKSFAGRGAGDGLDKFGQPLFR